MSRFWIPIGALIACLGVVAGAWGAHGLEEFLEHQYDDAELIAKRMADWKTGVLYQMHHAIAMVMVGTIVLHRSNRWLTMAGWGFLLGILLFSGTLQLLVLTGPSMHWAVIPTGGLCLIIGWAAFAIGGYAVSCSDPHSS